MSNHTDTDDHFGCDGHPYVYRTDFLSVKAAHRGMIKEGKMDVRIHVYKSAIAINQEWESLGI